MSAAVMSNSSTIIECGELFKNVNIAKVKEAGPAVFPANVPGHGHTSLRRSYSSLVSLIEQHRKLDRSVSEPTSRYKTELCRPFEENGSCKYGDKCQFAHGYGELRNLARHPKYKTELCRTFHKIGFCPYGPRCHFVHNFEEARINNLKLNSYMGQARSNISNLGSLLSPTNNAAIALNARLLEQLAGSSQVASVFTASRPLVCTNSNMSMARTPPYAEQTTYTSLHRSSSIAMTPTSDGGQFGRPKLLTISPTFSLGSTADSTSPSSSLSQSPTNSMASFFSDEVVTNGHAVSSFNFNEEFCLINTRGSPSPQRALSEELLPRTPSPITESRLPIFNMISSTLADLNGLRI